MSDFRMVLITVPERETAQKIAHGLVGNNLVACVNMVPGVESVYRWQGEIHQDSEILLICKTKAHAWKDLQSWVLENHPYDVPEIIQLSVMEGSQPYLDWITACLEK